jgi:hypothetical protein
MHVRKLRLSQLHPCSRDLILSGILVLSLALCLGTLCFSNREINEGVLGILRCDLAPISTSSGMCRSLVPVSPLAIMEHPRSGWTSASIEPSPPRPSGGRELHSSCPGIPYYLRPANAVFRDSPFRSSLIWPLPFFPDVHDIRYNYPTKKITTLAAILAGCGLVSAIQPPGVLSSQPGSVASSSAIPSRSRRRCNHSPSSIRLSSVLPSSSVVESSSVLSSVEPSATQSSSVLSSV